MKIMFHMMDLVGPQNACIGLGQILIRRGHEVYFLGNEKFCPKFERYGFKLCPMRESESRVNLSEENPVKQFIQFMIDNGIFTYKPIIEKMQILAPKKNGDIYAKCVDFQPQAKRYLEEIKPDFLVIDSDIIMPCLINANIPWALLFCSNPIGCFDSDQLPPFTSGLPIDGDRSEWDKYRQVSNVAHFQMTIDFQNKLSDMFNYPRVEGQRFVPHSPYLNIYQYPAELDYDDVIKIPDNFVRVDAFCREEAGSFTVPEKLRSKMSPGDKLIFLSLGSMGSCDIALMKKIVAILSKTKHYYIVAKGLLHDQYDLPDNMWGEAVVPQTKVLPLVDLVIMHGGNNTLTEAFSFGKPTIVLPIFYDQPDNAQRVQDKRFGIRIDTYRFEEDDLLNAIETILADDELKQRLADASKRIQTTNSKELACIAIENVIKQHNEQAK
ncbi:hypothetical protein BLOT_001764 [Blomia tropicalis]|nr:hypothetical protein BLOT_001764 [Blomia tropicalis]